MPHALPPPPTFSIALVSLSLSRASSPAAARPPRAFKLSPSQQAYVDAHSPPSEPRPEQNELQQDELQQGIGPSKRVSVSSAGRELLQGVLEARKARATARTSSGRSWREEGGFVESLEDVTEMARAERWA
ncbi:hypothetical protein GUITHDRAFT_110596 [Guillardia theta CCMP2712]|uniref:Uncharacterized protein n=1 Tax=Guillardia theta (strain CCMP2712) TaxID=905079 RepID=L1J4N7_GUITC|nr:hypothetical protein GUITHDRAFT_110596 [Guillardia theta CCMP2712]EKX43471.1 hypothetical protein GUITHDRAFT_110596 [Guillardia theta CCMP2712]|eukprot:XP_005830451.1 hypothetical protein GUITHDRAFT_110596 [Guillardia theta CCMP2712]